MSNPPSPKFPRPGARLVPVGRLPSAHRPQKYSLFQDVSPGNVGNVFEILPAEKTTFTVGAFGQPIRILDVRGDDVLGEDIHVSIQQETVLDEGVALEAEGAAPIEGPCTGIVEFGAGAGISSFEFDIPAPVSFPGNVNVVAVGTDHVRNLAVSKRNNGVLLSLPASSLRVFVRNDARAPYLISDINGGGDPIPINGSALAKPAKIRVHATYGRRVAQAGLFRSYPICHSDNGGPTGQFAPGVIIFMGIPAYARRVFFPRAPLAATSLEVTFFQSQYASAVPGFNTAFRSPYNLGPNEQGPLDIFPADTIVRITNSSDDNNITEMSVVFELGI